MTTEDEIRRAVAILDSQRAQLESLSRQDELIQLSIEEHLRAKETTERCRKAGKGTEVLVPVGAGTFLFMSLTNDGKALINVGSDIVLEEDIDKVLEKIDKRIKQLSDANKNLVERIAELDKQVNTQTNFVQNLYNKLKDENPEG